VALVDHANHLAIDGNIAHHPFDCPEGKQQLREWLVDPNPENFSYGQSAALALPFISNPERNDLLALAMRHSNNLVRLDAAAAAVKAGNSDGVDVLARACSDAALLNRAADCAWIACHRSDGMGGHVQVC